MDIKKFLESEYSYENFKKFIFDKFYGFEENNIDYEEPDTNIEQKHILKYKFMGSCQLDDKKEIGFFEVITTEKTDIENNRVSLGNILKNKASNELLDSAIAVFYNPNNPSVWRLSFIKFSYDENDKKEVSNLKRFTYVLGKNIPIKTAYNQLKNLKYPSLIELEEAFSVDKVTKEFYAGLVTLYNDFLETYLKYPNRSEQYENSKKEFAIRLIGRLLFIKFLNKKSLVPNSIFTVEKDYYNEVLEPLFFEKLNTPKKDRKPEFKDEQIPFLNGGLFEPLGLDFYDYKGMINFYRGDLIISDKFFEEFYSHLANYNFTIDENSLDDSELSIDPEMLGRIFENLLAEINPETKENARKSTGSFYTPREIVDYMVSSSIYEYLKDKTNIEENILKTIVFKNEEPKNDYDKTKILSALFELKILDPACGSGAFPMGILQKMMKILSLIDEDATIWFKLQSKAFIEENSGKNINYLRKLKIIKDSIFGVDIQPSAIEISKLRFFLSLIVDEDGEPEPLPNLEFKFVCANTLLPSPFNIKKNTQTTIFDNTDNINSIYEKIKSLKERYFYSSSKDKECIKKEYKNIQKELFDEFVALGGGNLVLVDYNPFDPLSVAQFYDSEFMFNIKDGFDIVIGNPPYGVSIKDDYRKKVIEYLGQVPDYEIYYFFIELSYKFGKKNGISSLIIPNTFLFNVYAKKFREIMLEKYSIEYILDCTSFKIFEKATVFNSIVLMKKNINDNKQVGYKPTKNIKNFNELILKETMYLTKEEMLDNIDNWSLAFRLDKDIISLVSKIKKNNKLIDYFPEISQGLIAYDKHRGQDEKTIKTRAFHHDNNINGEYKKWLLGENVQKYNIIWNEKEWIDYNNKIANPRNPKFFIGDRILVREITNPSIFAALATEEMYHDPAIISILSSNNFSLKTLLAILNSNFAKFYHFNTSPKATKGAFPKILVNDIKNFPIPIVSKVEQKTFEIIVDYVIYIKKHLNNTNIDNYVSNKHISKQFEDVIDAMVFELYFKEEFISKDIEFIKYVKEDFFSIEGLDDSLKEQIIRDSYLKLTESKNKIRNNLLLLPIEFDFIKTIIWS